MNPTINTKIDEWKKKLLDFTNRNRLLNCRIGGRNTLEIVHPNMETIFQYLVIDENTLKFVWKKDIVPNNVEEEKKEDETKVIQRISLEESLKSPLLEENDLLTSLSDNELKRKLKQKSAKAKESLDEHGINVLYFGFGLLKWFKSPNSNEPLFSPLYLVPVYLYQTSLGESWEVERYDDETMYNHSLWERMQYDFRLTLPKITATEFSQVEEFNDFFESIKAVIPVSADYTRWEIQKRVVMDCFNFQKLAMYHDMEQHKEKIAEHVLCRIIAGDESAYDLLQNESNITASELDEKVHPLETFSVLDSDSSQQEAIQVVLRGTNIILEGPPGTGKSQTIANIIAEMLSNNKTVLFVSEKAAAIDVVKKRLDNAELGDFCLDCHALFKKSAVGKKGIVSELVRCLDLIGEHYSDQTNELNELYDLRKQLNDYVNELHKPISLLQKTPFQVHGFFLKYKDEKQFRSEIPDPLNTTPERFRTILGCFEDLANNSATENIGNHSWQGCLLNSVTFELPRIKEDFTELGEIIEQCNTAVKILNENDFLDSEYNYDSLYHSLQKILPFFDTECTTTYITIPESWFEKTPELLYDFLSRLIEFRKNYRKLDEEYNNLIVDIRVKSSFESYFSDPKKLDTEFELLSSYEISNVIKNRFKETDFSEDKELLLLTSEQLNTILIEINQLLNLSLPPEMFQEYSIDKLPLQNLFKIAEWSCAVQALPEILPNWNDPLLDAKIKDNLNTYLEYNRKIKSYQENFDKYREKIIHLSQTALIEEESGTIANKVHLFDNFLKRILGAINGRLKKWKTEIADLYSDAVPAIKQVVSDMKNLQKYYYWHKKFILLKSENTGYYIEGGMDTYNQTIKLRNEMNQLFPSTAEYLSQILVKNERSFFSSDISDFRDILDNLFSNIESHSRTFILNKVTKSEYFKNVTLEKYCQFNREIKKIIDKHLSFLTHALTVFPNHKLTKTDFDKYISKVKDFSQKVTHLKKEFDILIAESEIAYNFNNSELETQIVSYQRFYSIFKEKITERNRRILTSKECYEKICKQVNIICNLYSFPKNKNLWEKLKNYFPFNKIVSTGITLSKLSLPELSQWLYRQAENIHLLSDWVKYKKSTNQLKQIGLHNFVEEIEEGTIKPDKLKTAFLARFYTDWLQAVYLQLPVLGNFSIDKHQHIIEIFRNYDQNSHAAAYKRLRQKLLNSRQFSSLNAPPSSDIGILRAESNKRRRLMSVRQLFSKINHLILQLKPCVMMSPLTVSTYLQNVTEKFDLVIFDEASQIRPHDAVTVIYRGKQIVIAGDPKQLPPTIFFERLDDENDNENDDEDEENVAENISDFESILDLFAGKLSLKRLRWHYRSRRESLIAFSNRNIYDGELVTFPSIDDESDNPAVKFEFVPNGRWQKGHSGGGFNQIEAAKAAELVFQFFREHPDKSLGVITFSQRQQETISDAIENLCKKYPEMKRFFSDNNDLTNKQEGFFVKNLENVQGDERDYIFLCIGYGKTEDGKMSMNFGPLNRQGGERRLNVAVTRAKYGITVISSIQDHDIDLQRTSSRGVKLLKDYLHFAEYGIKGLNASTTETPNAIPDSPFEYEVAESLRNAGFDVRYQIGCSGYRIDLALADKESPGRYVLGIECDGATYHSSATARDRDRLRQEILEGLGWTIHRIWSTDWIQNPKQQIENVKTAFESAKIKQKSMNLEQKIQTNLTYNEKPIPSPKPDNPFAQKYNYTDISKVSVSIIRETILYVLKIQQMNEDDLLRTVAEILGFKRVGTKIRQVLTKQLKILCHDKLVSIEKDQRLSVSQQGQV
jgi:superfamily I DNA and/or RNA helicase/very-short-patch-repair endonuclease